VYSPAIASELQNDVSNFTFQCVFRTWVCVSLFLYSSKDRTLQYMRNPRQQKKGWGKFFLLPFFHFFSFVC
jgi:hypothetical protein